MMPNFNLELVREGHFKVNILFLNTKPLFLTTALERAGNFTANYVFRS